MIRTFLAILCVGTMLASTAWASGPTTRRSTAAVPPPTIVLYGPTIPGPSRYFDGDLMATLAVKPQFQTEADRYNYHPTPWVCYQWCGYPGYGWGYSSIPWGGPVTPISGW